MKVLRVKCGNSVSAYGINKVFLYVCRSYLKLDEKYIFN